MLNPIYWLSAIKRNVSLYALSYFREKKLLKLEKTLKYPADIQEAKALFLKFLHDYTNTDLSDLKISELKKELKVHNYSDLLTLHKYFNTVRNFRNARLCFYEIIRRSYSFKFLFEPDGLKQKLALSLLKKTLLNEEIKHVNFFWTVKIISLLSNRYLLDQQIKGLINGEKVVVVGGAPDPEIEKFSSSSNIVARLNALPINHEKTDILYMRNERGSVFSGGQSEARAKRLNTIVSFKNPSHKMKSDIERSTITFNSDLSFRYGLLNGVQNCLLDIIQYSPSDLFITGVDFNLSSAYQKGYRPETLPTVKFDLIFGSHPPHVQYLLTKAIHNNYGLKTTEMGSTLISRSNRAFFKMVDTQIGV